ncbi:MAG: toll/interleukin-1 receptor domain-containing protein, partial [Deltaproteobacteria bacterium]
MSSIFISYSHADAKQQADLRRFLDPLERKGLIEFWDDTKIQTGDDWKREIDRALAASRMAVLLVTQNFLKSTFISDEELPYLLAKHKNKEITLLPVFLGVSNVGLAQPELSAIQG